MKNFWPEQKYKYKCDYIYRYKKLLEFHTKYLDDGISIDEALFYVKTRDELYYLLNLGADINYVSDHTEVTLIIFTCQSLKEKSDLFRALIENNSDIRRSDMFGHTAYYLALKCRHMDIIEIFDEYK